MCVHACVCGERERACVIIIDVFAHSLLVCFLTDLVRSSHCCERRETERETERDRERRKREGKNERGRDERSRREKVRGRREREREEKNK